MQDAKIGGNRKMSLIYCPECGHEISNSAVACPSCGRPVNARPVVEKRVVIADVPREREDGFPKWAFIPLGLIGAVLLLVFFVVMSRNSEDDNSNLSVNVSTRRAANGSYVPSTETQTLNVPPSSSGQSVTLPSDTATSTVNVPGSSTSVSGAPPTDKGTVTIDAKISTRTGAPRPVRNERFYLLDKDLESILSEEDIDPIEGQSLANSLGLSVLFPGRYSDFNRKAMSAINPHIKYRGQTDAAGKAQLGNVNPDSYYLFGITKTAEGFAVWSSPVTVIAGQNNLNLSPQPITEIRSGGE